MGLYLYYKTSFWTNVYGSSLFKSPIVMDGYIFEEVFKALNSYLFIEEKINES